MKQKKAEKILALLRDTYEGMTTALTFNSVFELLVSTMLAAQSTDVQVNKITAGLYKKANKPEHFVQMSQDELEKEIRSIGLYKNKARNIIAMSRMLLEEFNGEVPSSREELVRLPGVGRKTANVVLSVGFGKPAFAVDTHVFRVANRLGLTAAGSVEKTELQLMEIVPKQLWSEAHHWLIWHGRKICKARNPLCEACVLQNNCDYFRKQLKQA